MSDPPRRRGHMTTITVLSIDGGGIRGLIPAAFLDQLEQRTGRHVFELFDYVAGTSTGGILALGLGANRPAGQAPYTARELVGLYQATAADGRSYALVDGGVYANNPALCAWVEAHDRHPGDEIVVVSLGTGDASRPIPFERATNWGLAGWAPHLLDVIFDGVSDTVDVQLDEMLNPGGVRKYFRFQQDIPDAHQDMDDTSPENLAALRSIGEGLAAGRDFDAVCDLLEAVAAERVAPAA